MFEDVIWPAFKWIVVFMLFVFALTMVGNALGLFSYRLWAPEREEARREVYEETPSFVHGKRQYLTRLHMEWQRAQSEGARGAICSAARHEASTLDPKHLTETLSDWECVR